MGVEIEKDVLLGYVRIACQPPQELAGVTQRQPDVRDAAGAQPGVVVVTRIDLHRIDGSTEQPRQEQRGRPTVRSCLDYRPDASKRGQFFAQPRARLLVVEGPTVLPLQPRPQPVVCAGEPQSDGARRPASAGSFR